MLIPLGPSSAGVGTIGLVASDNAHFSTDFARANTVVFHRQLDEIARDGVSPSPSRRGCTHRLDQFRLDGAATVVAAGFTNLSRDHLDYHPDILHYLAAKLRLFRDLGSAANGAAVVQLLDHDCSAGRHGCRARTWGRRGSRPPKGDGAGEGIGLVEADIDGFAQKLCWNIAGANMPSGCRWSANSAIKTRWCPQGLAIGTGSGPDQVLEFLQALLEAKKAGWSGSASATARRSSSIPTTSPTLAKALQALRPYAKRNFVVVFGAGGDRDPGKRPLMGAIAAENADSVRHRRQSARRESGCDPRGDPERREERERKWQQHGGD